MKTQVIFYFFVLFILRAALVINVSEILQKNLDHLINSNQNPGYNTQILEHALCEYSKYHDYQTNIRKSHQKVYKPYKICYNI